MAVNIGPKIGIEGEAEYRKQINEIINQSKTLSSEMKALTSSFDKNDKSLANNKKQRELLTKQIEAQEKAVKAQQKMLDEATNATDKNGEHTDAMRQKAEKWQQVVNNSTAELNRMKRELEDLPGPMKLVGQSMQEVGKKMTEVGTKMSKTVTAPIVAFGTAAIKAFQEVDAGIDTIVQKTGASGEALAEMRESMENIATSIPTSFETAGAAIGEVNTRFGVTGQQLEDLTAQFIKFADLNGTDVSTSIDNVQKMMAAFGIETEDAAAVLDTLNKVGQDTGISVDKLASVLVTNGSALRELGLNAADAAVLMGELEKSGVDTSTVMTGLAKVQKTAMSEGISMSEALEKAVSSSGDAVSIFGAKAGPRLYEAFQSGILSLDMFSGGLNSLEDNIGNVSDTFNSTLDPLSQWQMTLNQLKITGAELGATIGETALPVIQALGDGARKLSEWFRGLTTEQQQLIVKVAAIAAVAGPALIIAGKIVSAVGTLLTLMNPVTLAIAGVALAIAGVVAFWPRIQEFFQGLALKLDDFVNSIPEKAAALLAKFGEGIMSALDLVGSAIGSVLESMVTTIGTWLTDMYNKGKDIMDEIFNGISDAASDLWESFSGIGSSIVDGVWSGISGAIDTFTANVRGFFSGIVDGVKKDLHINSPSKVFAYIGRMMGEGVQVGWDASMSNFNPANDLIIESPTVNATAGLAAAGMNSYSFNPNINFYGNYSERDGYEVAMSLDRWLGERV